jgi:hypothetical protein
VLGDRSAYGTAVRQSDALPLLANALLLGTLMYQSGLVPRVIPLMGLIGGPLFATAIIATLLGLIVQTTPWLGSSHSRWLFGSSRWASIWSSKALNPAPSQMQWLLPLPHPPNGTSSPNLRKHGRAH